MGDLELLVRLTEVLVQRGVPAADIDSFSRHWVTLVPRSDVPCPRCYLAEGSGHLIALYAGNGIKPLRCKNCGEIFNLRGY
jgi:hypothetical protein